MVHLGVAGGDGARGRATPLRSCRTPAPTRSPADVRRTFVRSSSNWQPGYATGVVAAQKGYKRAMTITWNHAGGQEDGEGLSRSLREGRRAGHQGPEPCLPQRRVPGLLTEIAAQKPDVVFAFFAGGGAVKFVRTTTRPAPEEQRAAVRFRLPDRRHAARRRALGVRGCSPRCTMRTAWTSRRTTASARASR